MTYFDSHAHYDDERFDNDRATLLAALPSLGVCGVVNAGANLNSSRASVTLAEAFSHVYAAAGVHPHDAETLDEGNFAELEKLFSHEKIVAVGEIGLDFYYDRSPRDTQRFWFKRQLALALKWGLPVLIHSREAAAEVFEIIQNSGVRKGVIHSYSGSAETAREYVKMGFYIGVGGVVTFDKTKKLPEVVRQVPLENILIETDAPYMTPAPHRGKRNDSSYLKYIVEAIAAIKNVTPEEVAAVTKENAEKLFRASSKGGTV
ncbi:MAG: TatD family hydrolase [Clostridiales bacterium]|jgi:TatD DNase family protein|nr:TatD family hydrolase [Clostridiales bacterium]